MPNGLGWRCAAVVLGLVLICASGGPGLAEDHAAKSKRQELDNLLRQVKERTAATRRKTAEPLKDVGIAGNENFTVSAPAGDFLCEAVLDQAEQFRKEISLAWLGKELPAGQEFTHIHVKPSIVKDEGLTMLCGRDRRLSGDHRMWLTTSRELALGSTLAHEITHVVLNARFPAGMPAWANEGIASRLDDAARAARREELLARFAQSGQWPSLAKLLDRPALPPTDETSYAAAVSLTELCLSLGDKAGFLSFVERGRQLGWDTALKQSYDIASTAELQQRWQAWVSGRQQQR